MEGEEGEEGELLSVMAKGSAWMCAAVVAPLLLPTYSANRYVYAIIADKALIGTCISSVWRRKAWDKASAAC